MTSLLWAARPWLLLLVLSLPLVLLACGDDDDDSAGPPSDEAYVRHVCDAVSDLQNDIGEISADAEDLSSVDDLEGAFEDMAEIFENAADSLAEANPPSDVEESHDSVVQLFRDMADALEAGDIEALEQFDPSEDFAPPADVQERLSGVAEGIDECEGLGVF